MENDKNTVKIEVGKERGHWVIKDNKPNNKKYLCYCKYCGNEKRVASSQLFDKRVDYSKPSRCRECCKLKVGDRYQTNSGFWYTVVEYNKSTEVTIRFDPDDLQPEGYVKKTGKSYIKSGIVDYPFERSSQGIGYCGYEKGCLTDHIHIRCVWSKMIKRCYNPNEKDKKAYQECTVCDEWHCFLTFYNWYKSQISTGYYKEGYQLDKDILKKGNTVYCPEFCRLVPEKINSFLNNYSDTRGTGLPNGVNWKEKNKKYQVSIKDENSKRRYLCLTSDIAYGYEVYCKEKENIARILSKVYDGAVVPEILKALENFKCPKWCMETMSYVD